MDRARRAMPIGNKQCYAKTVKANQDKHRMNLATVKCSVDNRPPQRFAHLQKNQKKEQMMVLKRCIMIDFKKAQTILVQNRPHRAPSFEEYNWVLSTCSLILFFVLGTGGAIRGN